MTPTIPLNAVQIMKSIKQQIDTKQNKNERKTHTPNCSKCEINFFDAREMSRKSKYSVESSVASVVID